MASKGLFLSILASMEAKMATNHKPEKLEQLVPAKNRLAVLATPVFHGQIDPEFDRNNFFNRAVMNPDPTKTLRVDTSPLDLFRQLLRSMGETVDIDMEELLAKRGHEYTRLLATDQSHDIDELIADTIPLNSAISQAYSGLRRYLDDRYNTMFETTCELSERFGKYAVAQCVVEKRI